MVSQLTTALIEIIHNSLIVLPGIKQIKRTYSLVSSFLKENFACKETSSSRRGNARLHVCGGEDAISEVNFRFYLLHFRLCSISFDTFLSVGADSFGAAANSAIGLHRQDLRLRPLLAVDSEVEAVNFHQNPQRC